jgi:phenylalanyl-tRNA synthetase alpha chain
MVEGEEIEELHPHELTILRVLNKKSTPKEISAKTGLEEDAIFRASSWLSGKDLVKIDEKIQEIISLGKEGEVYAKEGLPERQIINLIGKKEEEVTISKIQKKLGKEITSLGIGWLNKKKLAKIVGEEGKIIVLKRDKTADEKLLELLAKKGKLFVDSLNDELKEGFNLLKRRKNVIKISERKIIHLLPTKRGLDIGKKRKRGGEKDDVGISQLSSELLKTKKWREKKFRSYDVNIFVSPKYPAKKHPLESLIEKIRDIFLSLGFKEVSGPLVESAFWNFDALFQPQDHPARDMHDTFYLKHPKEVKIPGWERFKDKVKEEHELGWKYSWDENVAKKTLLRTHTTSVTARYLSKLKKENLPEKIFCIGKTFRNEAIDYKHLPEFYQVDGIVVDENANFRNLLGILKEFYDHMGFQVRFRPGYFPYTEPSLECEIFLEDRKEWIELGGAGIFRPEMTRPLLGFECPVLAWGLGLERLVALSLGLKDIREIYISDLDWLRKSKVV